MKDTMSRAIATAKARQRGFGLVEIMVALTLSLILLAGVLSVVLSSKVTYNENERVARTQEGGRAAFQMIVRDLRGAGFPGCAQPISGLFDSTNRLANPASPLWNFQQAMKGYTATGSGWTPALDAPLDGLLANASKSSDVIVIRRVQPNSSQYRTSAFINSTDDIPITKAALEVIAVGSSYVINDCANETFFAVTAVGGAGTAVTLKHAAGLNSANDLAQSFMQGALVSQVGTVVYYVAPGANGPSLWRIVGNNAADEVTSGVEMMHLQYGVDTDGDTVVDEYDDANTVNAANNWNRVVSVRIALLTRSPEANSTQQDTKTYALLNKNVPAFNDRYQRTVFTTSVQLRNQTR